MSSQGKPIRLFIRVSPGTSAADFGKALAPLETTVQRFMAKLSPRIRGAFRAMFAGKSDPFAGVNSSVDRLSANVDRLHKRLGAVGRTLRELNSANALGALNSSGSPTPARTAARTTTQNYAQPFPQQATGSGSPPRIPPRNTTSAASPAPGGNNNQRFYAALAATQQQQLAQQAAKVGANTFNPLAAGARLAGRAASFALNPIPGTLSAIAKGAAGAGGGILKFASTIYIAERAFRTLRAVFVSPFEKLIEATEDARKFVFTMAGPLNSLERARKLNAGLIRDAAESPAATVEGLRESARTLAFNPALSGRLSFANDAQARQQVKRFESLTRRLDVLDPQQAAMGGGTIAIRELVEGGDQATRSIRQRFGITGRTLARQIAEDFNGDLNKAMEEIKSNPTAALTGLERYVEAFVPEGAADRMGKLVSVRVTKLKEALSAGLADVGESQVFDSVVDKLERLQGDVFQHLDTPEWDAQSRRIGASLSRILGNLGGMVREFLKQVTGTQGGADTVGGTIELATKAIEKLGAASDALPDVGTGVGTFVRGLTSGVDKAVAQVERLIAAIENFSVTQNLVDGNLLTNLRDGGKSLSEAQSRVALSVAEKYGVTGGRVKKEDTNPLPANPGVGDLAARGLLIGKHALYDLAPRAARGEPVGDSLRAATKEGLDYAHGSRYVVDSAGVKDPSQRLALEKIFAAVQNLQADQLSPGRANVEVLAALRASDVLQKLTALKGVNPSGLAAKGDPVKVDDASDVPDRLRQLVEDEYTGPSYATMQKAITSATDKVATLAPESPLQNLSRQAQGAFTTDLAGDSKNPVYLAGVFDRIRAAHTEAADLLDAALREGNEKLRATENLSKQLIDSLAAVQKTRDGLGDRTDEAVKSARDALIQLGQDYGRSLAATLGELPPFARAELQQRIADGTTRLGNTVADALAKAGVPLESRVKDLGFDSLPLAEQQRQTAEYVQSRFDTIEASGRLGELKLGMGSPEIRAAYASRLSDDQLARKTLSFADGEGMKQQSALLDKALAAYQQTPNEQTLAVVAQATQGVAELVERQDQALRSLNYLRQGYEQFGSSVRQSLESGVGEGLSNLILGVGTLEDAFRSAGQSIVRAWADMVAKMAIQSLAGNLGVQQQNGSVGKGANGLIAQLVGAVVNGAASGGSYVGNGTYDVGTSVGTSSNFNPNLHANGGILRYANGGVVTKPTLFPTRNGVALVGERRDRTPEAVIPMLGRGRTIPISLEGGKISAVLPGGRSIPASIDRFADGGVMGPGYTPRQDPTIGRSGSGRGPTVETHVHAYDSKADADRAAEAQRAAQNEAWKNGERDRIVTHVVKDLREGGPISKGMRRR